MTRVQIGLAIVGSVAWILAALSICALLIMPLWATIGAVIVGEEVGRHLVPELFPRDGGGGA